MSRDDLLKLTLGELLERLLDARGDDGSLAGWVSIRDERWPWRRILAAAQRGECQVSKVGRQLLMRREELDRWLGLQSIRSKRNAADTTDAVGDHIDAMLRSKGYRRRRKAD